MSFIKKIIPWKKILIIDVWTYKIKVAYCEYKNSEISILSYWEKRQETSDIIHGEIANIESVSNTIEMAISKALKNQEFNPKNIIINIPTQTIISSSNKINYSRDKKNLNIDLNELDYIIWKVEKKALENATIDITKKTWYSEVDMKLITSSITDITIDNFKVSNPIWFTWENITLSTLNIFLPASRYNMINTVSNYLWKNILSIIPLEFSLPKILENSEYAYDDVIFIDVWNTKTSVIVQKLWVIIWFDKINIWINDLIKIIKENSTKTTIEIIEDISSKEDKFLKEKQDFLQVWEEWFIITLKEILKSNIIPNKIFVSGWWNNSFLKNHIKNIDLNKYLLHSLKTFNIINIDLEKDLKIIWNKSIFNDQHIWLLSMILATNELLNYKKNPVLDILKNFLEKNEF